MAISSTDRRTKNVQVFVEKDAVETSFAKWAQPGHFSRTLAKGPKTTTWIWNLHADAHDFDSQTSSLEEVSRKIFSAHFGQLAIIFLWISGMHFHGAYFSNYDIWLKDAKDYAGYYFQAGIFQLWRVEGILIRRDLKCAGWGGSIATIISVGGCYFDMHIGVSRALLSIHHLCFDMTLFASDPDRIHV